MDFRAVADAMADPNSRKSDYLVLDPNILGLSRVLYHYDKRLNQFGGAYLYDSIYPTAELVALRLFLLQKRNRGEKMNLTAILQRRDLFLSTTAPVAADITETGLNQEEIEFLQDVFRSGAFFFEYLQNPFLVKALHRLDVIQTDGKIQAALRRAHYRSCACHRRSGSSQGRGGKNCDFAFHPGGIRDPGNRPGNTWPGFSPH